MVNEQSVMAVIRATRPTFRNDNDKVAFAVHAIFLASGCVLTATGPPAFTDAAFSSPSKDEISIEGWNELEDEYAYVYANLEKDSNWKKVIVKCLVMNGKLLIDALTDENSEPLHLEIDVEDIVNPNGGSNYSTQYRNLDTLVKRLGSGIFSKLGGYSKATTSNPARGGLSGDGSMLLGPNDPRWLGVGRGPGFEGGQPGVPPGARFDPYGPPGVPGFEPFRFVRNPGRPGGGTHPDLEHFGDGSDFI
ncbi:probable proteasome inhibitor isoform X4 [Cucurbita pepo subsp. pepo]|uniref:probable proteasome inhibitor isoform X4 n=1 Tax=Cucurbita pepo subsp. pepo TaxID=3664 RepID=UPI000C9D7874|nr:probable proteasome inhibitor isoform X4 [Cucurbita pepo subsp. pepo]